MDFNLMRMCRPALSVAYCLPDWKAATREGDHGAADERRLGDKIPGGETSARPVKSGNDKELTVTGYQKSCWPGVLSLLPEPWRTRPKFYNLVPV